MVEEEHTWSSWNRRGRAGIAEMLSRLPARHARALLGSSMFSVIAFLLDALGYNGKVHPWGPMRSLSEIWWHFPASLLLCYLFLLFMADRSTRR